MKTNFIYKGLTTMSCISASVVKFKGSLLKLFRGAVMFLVFGLIGNSVFGQVAASFNYTTQTGTLETTYSWIDCSSGSSIVSGDDSQASISWPFDFSFYDNNYTTANSLSVATNGFIRLDAVASTNYSTARAYTLSSASTELGQIIAMDVYDDNVGTSSWVRSLVTGSSPNRVFTIEYNNHEIDYNDGRYADVQVSFYETSNKVVLKLGTDNITKAGVDMGIHSGVSGYSNKWQEVYSGTNNTWIEYTPGAAPPPPSPPSASWNYTTQTGFTETTYSWIDCSSGTTVVSGDDEHAEISWPFDFSYYDNSYTTANNLSVSTNGFIRLDGIASTIFSAASAYNLTSTATNLGQIIALDVYDGKVGDNGGWVRSLVSGTAPDRIFTIEYNNHEIDYNDRKYADVQVSFYESTNKIVLKLGDEDLNKSGVDMGLHSGVNTFFNKWQEVNSGTNNTWIEYSPPYVEVNASTGTALAYYYTLKGAFDKINDGTHQGAITVKIKHSTTETASAVLNGSGTGSANYASVNIYPTETGFSISGDLAAPLIDLDGADNVTIDGRVNATGSAKDLSIINTSTASTAGTSAIRFINDASNNTVKYCTIKGSETGATSGIVFFSTTTETTGNDNNTIEYNDITNAVDANRPVNAIYSLGTAGKDNSANIISNNNIYDFINHASASRGILLEANTTAWTIDGNSFYETISFTGTGTVTYDAIKINNVSGNGFTISNNYFGGNEVECGGNPWTKTNATNNVFNAIYINVGSTVASSIQNNTIKNFNWSNSGIATWTGINIYEGSIDIGTITGNTIGATTGTGFISVRGGTNGQAIYGIKIESTGVINCNNNNIGSITGLASSAFSTHIYGIDLSGSATASITNNTIGSTSTTSSIYASSASTANVQKVYGIYSSSSGVTHIHENTISNLKNNTSNTAVGTRGLINGIYLEAGTNTVCENTIRDISIANASFSTWTPSAIGIHLNTTTDAQSIHENLIYNISNTYSSFTGCVVGIFTRNSVGASAGDVSANFIHSLSVNASSTGAKIYGIYENTDNIIYANNIISVGGSTSTAIYGIYDDGNSGKTVDLFFNTVYVSGTNSGSEKSYAIRYNTNSNTRDLRNNVLFNARSGGTGGHYAIYYDATGGTFTADYNDYYVSGTGGVIGYFGGDKSTLALLQTATSQDANSLNTNPSFTSAGGLNSSDYVTSASLPGVTGTSITTDYDGITRDNPPKMGALELSLNFVWEGTTSTDFATTTNWENGAVPPGGADISFATTPTNDCYLDQNRTLKNITNTSAKRFVVNGKQLTLTGDIVSATADQIDASAASSVVIFEGTAAQSIPSGIFVSNTIDGLTLNNSHGLTQNGDLILSTTYTLTIGTYSIGANTLTINGAISTTSGTLTGGSTSNIVFGGSGASTTLQGVSLNNLTLNRSNGMSLGGAVSVEGTLALTAGTLTVGANTLTISGNSPTRVSGNIDPSNASATMEFTNSSSITCPESIFSSSINNLTINGAGINACCSCTINGILNLQSANPSSTMGTLDMGSDTLTMGVNATTTGIGDVTGIVKREHTFSASTEYSFGSQYTTFTFTDGNLKPTWIILKISIGSVPSWSPWNPTPNGKVKRLYKVASSDNSSTSQATINMRYLVSEMDATYNDESKLVFWHKLTGYASGVPHEHGKATQDFTNHYIGVTGLPLGSVTTTDLDDSQIGLAYSVTTKNTWRGTVSGSETEWEQAQNWTAGHVPLSTEDVLIPGGSTYYPSLTASSSAVAKSIEIEIGASITANSYDITISGFGGAWFNQGTFYPGTGTVFFNHGVSTEIVTVAGVTNFYDIEVGVNTSMQPVPGSILRIAGAGTADVSSLIDFSTINNTVEWNGTNQNILNPQGIGGNSGYYNLILSGSGTKTMHATAMNIVGNFTLSGTAIATAASALTIGGNFKTGDGTTFATGAFDHTVSGNFDNSGTFTTSSGKIITMNGTSAQSILGVTATSFEKLTINNSAGVDIFTDVTVNNTLTLTSGNLNAGATTLTLNGDAAKTSGFIDVSTLSSLVFGGTTAFSTGATLFYTTPNINNLTINRTGGVSFGTNLTVNGIIHLQSDNPSLSKGSLDMGTDTLNMGATSTTTGIGDVTGIIYRKHSINLNTAYTFGNTYSYVLFPDVVGQVIPSSVGLKVTLGTSPGWVTNSITRLYELSQSGNGTGTRAFMNIHYKENEIPLGVSESLLTLWINANSFVYEKGKSSHSLTENYMTISDIDFINIPSSFGILSVAIAPTQATNLVWNGSIDTDWDTDENWTPVNQPSSSYGIIIPNTTAITNKPILPVGATCRSVLIESGGTLNSATDATLTITGINAAWIKEPAASPLSAGIFNAGNSTITFNSTSGSISIVGSTNFYNITVSSGALLMPAAQSHIGIAGILLNSGTLNAASLENTIEFNGANQTIINPNGTSSGYYNLILSGSGTKTMPSSAMTIHGDFSTSGTATATAAESMIVYGNTSIGSGSAFATGSLHHLLSGDFVNNGTFTPTTGGNVTFVGTVAQTISGSSTTNFDSLCISNSLGVSIATDVNVNNVLGFSGGFLSVGSNLLGINGTIFNPSGYIDVSSVSSLSFGGTSAITLNNNLFNGDATINNLTINRSGGVTLGNESITVGGTLILTAGTFTVAANTLTLAGNSPTRTSGNIDVSNAIALIEFINTSAITLPASVFSGNVNDMTIDGAGGVTSGSDISMNGILYLQSANPSSTKGCLDMSSYTLNMGANATTIGQGDVSGIIRRTSILSNTTYSFGNQYSTVYFPDVGTLPTEISLKVTLGSGPSWRTGTINRIYDIIQTGGSGTQALIQNHYLDSELNGNDENLLGEWLYIFAYPLTIDYGRSGNNISENWVTISNVNIGVFSNVFGANEITMDEYENTNLTWNGSTSSSWVTASNWTPMGAPSDETVITIPDATTTNNDPSIPEIAICGKMIIESDGILNSISGGKLTLTGSSGAWVNNGTFNPETGTVIFHNGDETDAATISGTTDFYNLTIGEKTWIQPAANSIINIAGQLSADTISSILDFGTNANTVNYNGSKTQNIFDPGSEYYNLSLGGSGTKILPATSIQIIGDFVLSESASTTSYYDLTVGGDLLLSNSSNLTIEAGKTLTVTGTTTNSVGVTGLVLLSSNSGTASLIHNTDNVPATMQRYVSGAAEDWHFLSSPVANQEISGDWIPSGTYGNGTGYDLYAWNEPTNCWVYHLNTTVAPNWPTIHPSANFVAGRGYLYSVQASNPTKSFAGNLNNGDQTIPLTYSSAVDSVKGFNLVGNPYPSSIDWMASSGWTRSNLATSGSGNDMWIWNPEAGNYGVCNSATGAGTNSVTRYIAPMQGYFVRAESAGNLEMANDVRVHDATTAWKSVHITPNRIAVVVYSDSDDTYDEVRLLFGYPENQPGAAKLFSPVITAPSLYLPLEDANYTIRYLSDTVTNPHIPIMFKPGRNGNYSINFNFEFGDFNTVVLEDKLTGDFIDLNSTHKYEFTASKTDNLNRFVLHFSEVQTDTNQKLPARIYSTNGKVVIDLTAVNEITNVKIVDVLGRTVLQRHLNGNTIHHLPVNVSSQVLIIFAKTKNAIVSKKVFVNKI